MIARLIFMLGVAAFAASGAQAAPHHKQVKSGWHGYGFLPGYHQPLSNSQPVFDVKPKGRAASRVVVLRKRPPWYIDPVPSYYGFDGDWHYFGRPGFYRGRYNGGSFGPCYTRTPAGPIWNCG